MTLFAFLGVTSLLGFGTQLSNDQPIERVEATSGTSDRVYLDINGTIWGSASAYYTIHYWGGNTESAWPGVPFNNGQNVPVGAAVVWATWDPTSTHVIINRYANASAAATNPNDRWNYWNWFETNSFTAGQYNFFLNTDWYSCDSDKVLEHTGSVYLSDKNNWTVNANAYAFNSKYQTANCFGAWPGTPMEKASDVTFDGVKGLYRITFDRIISDTLIFNNGDGGYGNETAKLKLTPDGHYTTHDVEGTPGDVTKGAAAKYVYDLDEIRRGVTAGGNIKVASICGISREDRTMLINNYNALSASIKTYVDNAKIYTYANQSSTSPDTEVMVPDILAELSLLSGIPLQNINYVNLNNDNSTSTIIAVTIGIAFVALGTAYVIKLRKRTA